jgi:perosamine synthetase
MNPASAKKPALLGGPQTRIKPFALRKTMGDLEKKAVMEVMDSEVLSGFFGSPGPLHLGGPRVRSFEQKWATKYGFKHAISVNSWTTGLMTAVGAVGISPGDEVICPPYTMSASATSILFYGGIPVFADIDPETFNISPAAIERVISSRTKAIMVVHLFGQAADMDAICAIAKKHGLKVIEDAAHAPGITYKNRPVGAIGDVGGFSLNYHKHIHTGEGGMLVTNDDKIAQRCQLIRNHGENLVEWLEVEDLSNTIGANYRLTEMQAAIGEVQLDRLDAYLAARKRLAVHLSNRIAKIPGLTPPKISIGNEHAFYVYAIRFDAKIVGLDRKRFAAAVNAELPKPESWDQTGLSEGYVKPLYLAKFYQEKVALGHKGFPWSMNPDVDYSYKKGAWPIVEDCYERSLLLTSLVREPLTESDMDDFADALEKIAANAKVLNESSI